MDNNERFIKVTVELADEFVELLQNLKQALPHLNKENSNRTLGDWIPESEAQQILGRKTTWFYNKRMSGELEGKKRGGKWWYQIKNIQAFIEN